MNGAVVLLSGGLDSSVCIALAARDGARVVALCIDYGQRNRIELDYAHAVAAHYDAEVVDLALDLGTVAPGGIAGTGEAPLGDLHVPARGLVFLSVAMAVAEARDLDRVYQGSTAADHEHHDARPAFFAAYQAAADAGLERAQHGRPIRVHTPLLGLTKSAVILAGLHHRAPMELTWSCFEPGPEPCRSCPACTVRQASFDDLGIPDPALP